MIDCVVFKIDRSERNNFTVCTSVSATLAGSERSIAWFIDRSITGTFSEIKKHLISCVSLN